jgi:hypothetical protein
MLGMLVRVQPTVAIGRPPARIGAARLEGTWALVALAVAFAGASLLVDRTLRFDAVGWLRWGREVGLGQLDTSAMPSWKPLPLLITTPLAATGGAAGVLWLALVRTAGLLSLALVFRLTSVRTGSRAAGTVAAATLAAAPAWWTTVLGGGIEPVVVLLGCLAVIAHQRGRQALAVVLMALMALGREEAVALIVVYGLVQRRERALAAAAAAAVLGAWLGGDWIGSGNPLHGGELARAAGVADAAARAAAGETRGGATLIALLVVLPQLGALALLGARTAWRSGDRLIPALTAVAALWAAMDLTLLLLGYPLPPRFLLPAAAAATAAVGLGATTLRTVLTR